MYLQISAVLQSPGTPLRRDFWASQSAKASGPGKRAADDLELLFVMTTSYMCQKI
jgi:hypothetical protein